MMIFDGGYSGKIGHLIRRSMFVADGYADPLRFSRIYITLNWWFHGGIHDGHSKMDEHP
jgi:hypothetical protein